MQFTSRLSGLNAAILLSVCSLFTTSLKADETVQDEHPCQSQVIGSVPSRPTVSNGTDVTQCGVLELEYGLERQWVRDGVRQDDFSGGIRFGIAPKLDFQLASADFMNILDDTGTHKGFGDTWVGLKYHFSGQGRYMPSLGVFYSAKVPSASSSNGLGTGQVDHAISFLVSKDVHALHFDFNVIPLLAGRPSALGMDHNVGFALSSSVPLNRHWGFVTEGYGYTALNSSNPAFASAMAGFTYMVNRRLIFDAGLDVGLTRYAPNKRVYFGVTYALAKLYKSK